MQPSLEETLGELIASHKQTIIDRAVEKLSTRVAKMCLPDLQKQFTDRTLAAMDEKIAEQLKDLQAIPYTETDCYGNPRPSSTPKTLMEILMARVKHWLEDSVDENGRTHDTYGTRKRRVEWLIHKAAADMVKSELETAIKKAKEEFKAAVQAKLSTAFKNALVEAIKP